MPTETPDDGETTIPVEVEGDAGAPAADAPGIVEAAPAPPDPTATLREQIAALEKEKKELHDRLLRTAADFENFRKRTRKEVDDARAKAREDVFKEVLPGIDNLERALLASGEATATVANVVDGVRLVLRQFQSALERFEVKGFASVGEAFDPSRHEAISQLETADRPPGTVAVEMVRGYMIGARLLRPALVAVAKAPAQAAAATAEEAAPTAAPEAAPAPATEDAASEPPNGA